MRARIEHGNPASFFGEGCACNSCTTAAVIASPKVAENMMARQIGRDNAKRKVERMMTTHANDSVFASDHDREVVCNQLATATGEGRITADEHEDLVTRALASRKRGELRRLIEELPNPKLPDLPTTSHPPVATPPTSISSIFAPLTGFAIFLTVGILMWISIGATFNGSSYDSNPPATVAASPTPNATITDPQDRAFVQAMIDYHNDCRYSYDNCNNPTNIDQSAVLDIAHRLRNSTNDVRQQFLLIMDSNAYKELTAGEKYRAGKTALSVWRAGDEAAWIAMGKDQGYE